MNVISKILRYHRLQKDFPNYLTNGGTASNRFETFIIKYIFLAMIFMLFKMYLTRYHPCAFHAYTGK